MSSNRLLCFLFFPLFSLPSFTGAEIVLMDQGKSDYKIVLSQNAPSSEKHAARELRYFLNEICGSLLPIITDEDPLPEHAVLLGESKALDKIGVSIDFSALGKEGYVLRTKGSYLVIAGGKPRGALYGVYGLLTDYLGCRWFMPDCSRIPRLEKIVLPPIDEQMIPRLEYRDVFCSDVFDGDWVLRNRMNSSHAKGVEDKGGKVRFGSMAFVHTFYSLVPPAEYFGSHPEYFAQLDGTRRKENAQLCLTNPDVVRIASDKVKEWIRKDPEAQIFSVSQNDCHGNCQCPGCKAIDDREGSPAGSLVEFVNAIAEEVEKEYPDVSIETLAYQYTRKPPKTVHPGKNVIIRLCSIECCFGHPLATDDFPQNSSFREDIKGWHTLTDRLYVWDYVTNFPHYVMPHPNLRVLKPNIQFFVENGVKGIFEQGNYSPGMHGEMAALRSWLLAKFLWDPSYDYETAMREFIEAFYGPAAPMIREYIELMHNRFEETHTHLNIWTPPTALHLDEETLKKADVIFDRAERCVADNPTLLLRIRDARLPVEYVKLSTRKVAGYPSSIVRDGKFGPDPDHPWFKLVSRFNDIATILGMSHISEGRTMEDFLSEISRTESSHDVMELPSSTALFQIVPDLGGRILSWKRKRGDWEALAFPEGFREWYSPGAKEAHSEVKFSSNKDGYNLLLQTNLENMEVKREYRTDETEPVLNIRTMLRGLGAGNDKIRFARSSSAWNLGSPQDLILGLPSAPSPHSLSLDSFSTQTRSQIKLPLSEYGREFVFWNERQGQGLKVSLPEKIARLTVLFDPRQGIVRFSDSSGNLALGKGEYFNLERSYELLDKLPESFPQTRDRIPMIGSDSLEAGPEEFRLFREGELSKILKDDTAEDGFCAWMPGNTIEWAVQWHFDHELLDFGLSYEAFVLVKAEKKGNQGQAFTSGIWDRDRNQSLGEVRIEAKNASSESWEKFKIGTFTPGPHQYLWIAPTNNLDNVTEIRVAKFALQPCLN